MTPKNIPYLCGSIFFDLLLQARKPRKKARDTQNGGTDGLSDQEVMKGLIFVITGDEDKLYGDFSKSTSEYKTCKCNGNTYIPFNATDFVSPFIDSLNRKNPDLQSRMSEFIDRFILHTKYEWLVKSLIETLHDDAKISDETVFSINQTEELSISDLLSVNTIELEIFLLSIFGYILQNRTDNSLGLDTFHAWYERESKQAPWKFKNNSIGYSINHEISIIRYQRNGKNDEYENDHEYKTDILSCAHAISNISRIALNCTKITNSFFPQEDDLLLKNVDMSMFEDYLNKATKFYENIKTLLYSEKPKLFKDFYVCNHLQAKDFVDKPYIELIKPDITSLLAISNRIIISGTGGIGKSMMMRHLFFDCAENYKPENLLPILVPLNNYKKTQTDLTKVLYDTICEFTDDVDQYDFDKLLRSEKLVILLDGLDEVVGDTRIILQSALTNLIKKYPKIAIIISSRPNNLFVQMGHFQVIKILPFEKEQALELVEKLDFHDKVVKKKFKHDLDTKLFLSHMEFASNPLLLTIMLMTYSSYGEVPAKRHIFYSKAYETMARLHDATKGAYVRPMKTNLSPEEFAEYFSEFCARTYKDGIFEFTANTFSKYMDAAINHIGKCTKATSIDFLADLTNNLCIMYKEGEHCYFFHRTFQEYFCAVYFSTRMDDKLKRIGDFFETQSTRLNVDHTFDMLYDMIPDRIDRFVFLPFLQELWDKCDKAKGYWTYLEEMYSEIYCEVGKTRDFYDNEPSSFLYDFIINKQLIDRNGELYKIKWPSSINYCDKEDWVTIEIYSRHGHGNRLAIFECIQYSEWEHMNIELIEDDNVDIHYDGSSVTIDINEIQNSNDLFSDLINFIDDDSFPLKEEYNKARMYTGMLSDKFNTKHDADDWFDNL